MRLNLIEKWCKDIMKKTILRRHQRNYEEDFRLWWGFLPTDSRYHGKKRQTIESRKIKDSRPTVLPERKILCALI